MRANCLLLVAGLLAIMVVADAKVCGTKGAKTFRIKKNKFVDVGAGGGYAQRALNDLAGQVTTALIKDGFLPRRSKLTGYVEQKGCYKTLVSKAGDNLVGEYEFLYVAEYSRKVGRLVRREYYEIRVLGEFTRGKVLLKGKADVVELPGWP